MLSVCFEVIYGRNRFSNDNSGFKDLEVWNIGFDLMIVVYEISRALPKEEKYGLDDQIRQASVSIPSNIAEGCSRSSDKEFKWYLEIAMRSPFELKTQVLAIEKLAIANHKLWAIL